MGQFLTNRSHEGSFTAAVRPDNGQTFSCFDRKMDVRKQRPAVWPQQRMNINAENTFQRIKIIFFCQITYGIALHGVPS